MELRFSAVIIQNGDMDAAYVIVPYDIKKLCGKGRLLVNASFDGVPYSGVLNAAGNLRKRTGAIIVVKALKRSMSILGK